MSGLLVGWLVVTFIADPAAPFCSEHSEDHPNDEIEALAHDEDEEE